MDEFENNRRKAMSRLRSMRNNILQTQNDNPPLLSTPPSSQNDSHPLLSTPPSSQNDNPPVLSTPPSSQNDSPPLLSTPPSSLPYRRNSATEHPQAEQSHPDETKRRRRIEFENQSNSYPPPAPGFIYDREREKYRKKTIDLFELEFLSDQRKKVLLQEFGIPVPANKTHYKFPYYTFTKNDDDFKKLKKWVDSSLKSKAANYMASRPKATYDIVLTLVDALDEEEQTL